MQEFYALWVKSTQNYAAILETIGIFDGVAPQFIFGVKTCILLFVIQKPPTPLFTMIQV